MQRREDSQKELKNIIFQKEQNIFIKKEDTAKLEDVNEGPFRVIQDLGPNVLIEKNGKIETVHKNRTILFKD